MFYTGIVLLPEQSSAGWWEIILKKFAEIDNTGFVGTD
jgi:hypothetical protein